MNTDECCMFKVIFVLILESGNSWRYIHFSYMIFTETCNVTFVTNSMLLVDAGYSICGGTG
jgi:hypothetical protein